MEQDILIQQLFSEVKEKFGDASDKMFAIIIIMILMDKNMHIPEYLRIPELNEYINFIETNQTLHKLFFSEKNLSLEKKL